MQRIIKQIVTFTSCIWQIYPFLEENTRTMAVFIECNLNYLGFLVDNEMFKTHSVYFRNALGKANCADYPVRVVETDVYLIGLYTNLLMEKVELRAEDIG